MPTQSWSNTSAVFLMESALTSHGSSKSNKKPSDGRGISDYQYRYFYKVKEVLQYSWIFYGFNIELFRVHQAMCTAGSIDIDHMIYIIKTVIPGKELK